MKRHTEKCKQCENLEMNRRRCFECEKENKFVQKGQIQIGGLK